MRISRILISCILAFLFVRLAVATDAVAESGDYVVAISKATKADQEWAKVSEALLRKHHGVESVYESDVADCLGALKQSLPRYVCFVARPEEATREFVVKIHRLTRKLNDDPYGDCLWGIVTGFDAKSAMRIASCSEPLLIRKGSAGTGLNLDVFDEGVWFSEGTAGEFWQKAAGGKAEKKSGPADSIKALVDTFNTYQPDFFLTSGHASEYDWQPGYSYRNGDFRSRNGQLIGRDLQNALQPVNSPNPKVYLAAGNCLIGHVKDKNSMALAWLGSGGANQMVGYTVVTWYGAMGWGTKDFFFDLPGRYSLAEAFYFSNQAILHKLQTRFPADAKFEFNSWDLESNQGLLNEYAKKLTPQKSEQDVKDLLGLLWDRDTVAFYGDPGWVARLAPRELPLNTEIVEKDGSFHYLVHVTKACLPGKPLSMLLPKRVKDVELVHGQEFEPLITSNAIMLMKSGSFEAGKTYDVEFKAKVVK